jgi:hypothetical protein
VAHVRQVLAQAHQVVQAAHVRQVPAVQVAQAASVVEQLVQASAAVLVPVTPVASVPHAQAALQLVAVVAAAEPQVPSARVVRAAHPRLASRSVPSARNLSREPHRALVARSFHVAMAAPLCACVAVPAFKTSQTRLMQMLVS